MILMDFSYFFLLFSGFLEDEFTHKFGLDSVKSKFVCKFIFQLCGFIYATFIFKRFD